MFQPPYSFLEDYDIMVEGDEIQFNTPMSRISQHVDTELDDSRREWKPITRYWFGKKFGTYRKGLVKFGEINCRRKHVNNR